MMNFWKLTILTATLPWIFTSCSTGGNATTSSGGKRVHLLWVRGSGRGDVVCNITPEEAIVGGAVWRVKELAEGPYGSGQEINIPVGDYTITFSAVTGFTKPADIPLHVIEDDVVTKQGNYITRGKP